MVYYNDRRKSDMARRSNVLDEGELAILKRNTKSYVETFEDAINIFLKDCEIRNLRPHTIRFYRSEINTFLNYLKVQDIDVSVLKPYSVTDEHIKENVILYLRKYKGARVVTVNTRLRALRAFFNFLHRDKHIPQNPFERP
jgi:integrase/recombinase XerD